MMKNSKKSTVRRCDSSKVVIGREEILSRFDRYVKEFDFGKYAPFYHGKTIERGKKILKEGLLTRKDAPFSGDVCGNKWGSDSCRSMTDYVYFSACTERVGA